MDSDVELENLLGQLLHSENRFSRLVESSIVRETVIDEGSENQGATTTVCPLVIFTVMRRLTVPTQSICRLKRILGFMVAEVLQVRPCGVGLGSGRSVQPSWIVDAVCAQVPVIFPSCQGGRG